jgi:hypothetical protein
MGLIAGGPDDPRKPDVISWATVTQADKGVDGRVAAGVAAGIANTPDKVSLITLEQAESYTDTKIAEIPAPPDPPVIPVVLVISPDDPNFTEPGLWVQTNLGDGTDFSIWIEDGI